MVSSTEASPSAPPHSSGFRWIQLAMGIVCMAMIANLQYGWTLFVDPIDAKYHWGRTAIQLAFTIFVVTETWLVPVEAWFVDKYGPRIVIMFGGVMIALAWVLNSYADSLTLLYAAAVVGGIGAGAVYGTCVGNALKWFPDRRGLAAGATAAGFGAGAALTVVPIASMIAASGYQSAFFTFGIGQGLIVFVLALFLRPPSHAAPARKKQLNLPQTKIDYTPPQVLRAPIFWIMYLVFVMVASGGLMTAAQIAPIAKDFGISKSFLTNWMRQAEIEDGTRPGAMREDAAELREARNRIRLLEQENEVLRRATAYLSQANLPGKALPARRGARRRRNPRGGVDAGSQALTCPVLPLAAQPGHRLLGLRGLPRQRLVRRSYG